MLLRYVVITLLNCYDYFRHCRCRCRLPRRDFRRHACRQPLFFDIITTFVFDCRQLTISLFSFSLFFDMLQRHASPPRCFTLLLMLSRSGDVTRLLLMPFRFVFFAAATLRCHALMPLRFSCHYATATLLDAFSAISYAAAAIRHAIADMPPAIFFSRLSDAMPMSCHVSFSFARASLDATLFTFDYATPPFRRFSPCRFSRAADADDTRFSDAADAFRQRCLP